MFHYECNEGEYNCHTAVHRKCSLMSVNCCISTFRVTPLFVREDSRLPETGSHHQRKQVGPVTHQAVLDSGGLQTDCTQECRMLLSNLHVCGEGRINVGHFTSCVISRTRERRRMVNKRDRAGCSEEGRGSVRERERERKRERERERERGRERGERSREREG